MTLHQVQLQALITEIESLLGKATPRLPWVMAGETNQQRQLLEQVLEHLKNSQSVEQQALAGSSGAVNPAIATTTPGAEATSQQLLQALLQEVQYLRAQVIQPLTNEVVALQQQQQQLQNEVRQLELQRSQLTGQTNTPQLDAAWVSAIVEELQPALMAQIAPQLEALQAQINDPPLLYSASQDPREVAADLPVLHPQQRLEQLRQIQTQTDDMLLKLDANLRTVFDSLDQSIQSYCDSLTQGLDAMHGLGQQGEVVFRAFINHLAQQIGSDSTYVSVVEDSASPLLEGEDIDDYDVYDEGYLDGEEYASAEASLDPLMNLDDLDLDTEMPDGEEITLFQLDEEITQLQLTDEDDVDVLAAEEDITVTQDDDETFIQIDSGAEATLTRESAEAADDLAATSTDTDSESGRGEEIDALYESLFGDSQASSNADEAPQASDADSLTTDSSPAETRSDNLDTTLLAIDHNSNWEAQNAADALPLFETEDLAPAEEAAIADERSFPADSTLTDLLASPADSDQEIFDSIEPDSSDEAAVADSAPESDPNSDNVLADFLGAEVAEELTSPANASSEPEVITSLADLLPATDNTSPQRFGDLPGTSEDASEDAFIPAPLEEDLLASDSDEAASVSEIALSLDEEALGNLSADLSSLEGLSSAEVGMDEFLPFEDGPETLSQPPVIDREVFPEATQVSEASDEFEVLSDLASVDPLSEPVLEFADHETTAPPSASDDWEFDVEIVDAPVNEDADASTASLLSESNLDLSSDLERPEEGELDRLLAASLSIEETLATDTVIPSTDVESSIIDDSSAMPEEGVDDVANPAMLSVETASEPDDGADDFVLPDLELTDDAGTDSFANQAWAEASDLIPDDASTVEDASIEADEEEPAAISFEFPDTTEPLIPPSSEADDDIPDRIVDFFADTDMSPMAEAPPSILEEELSSSGIEDALLSTDVSTELPTVDIGIDLFSDATPGRVETSDITATDVDSSDITAATEDASTELPDVDTSLDFFGEATSNTVEIDFDSSETSTVAEDEAFSLGENLFEDTSISAQEFASDNDGMDSLEGFGNLLREPEDLTEDDAIDAIAANQAIDLESDRENSDASIVPELFLEDDIFTETESSEDISEELTFPPESELSALPTEDAVTSDDLVNDLSQAEAFDQPILDNALEAVSAEATPEASVDPETDFSFGNLDFDFSLDPEEATAADPINELNQTEESDAQTLDSSLEDLPLEATPEESVDPETDFSFGDLDFDLSLDIEPETELETGSTEGEVPENELAAFEEAPSASTEILPLMTEEDEATAGFISEISENTPSVQPFSGVIEREEMASSSLEPEFDDLPMPAVEDSDYVTATDEILPAIDGLDVSGSEEEGFDPMSALDNMDLAMTFEDLSVSEVPETTAEASADENSEATSVIVSDTPELFDPDAPSATNMPAAVLSEVPDFTAEESPETRYLSPTEAQFAVQAPPQPTESTLELVSSDEAGVTIIPDESTLDQTFETVLADVPENDDSWTVLTPTASSETPRTAAPEAAPLSEDELAELRSSVLAASTAANLATPAPIDAADVTDPEATVDQLESDRWENLEETVAALSDSPPEDFADISGLLNSESEAIADDTIEPETRPAVDIADDEDSDAENGIDIEEQATGALSAAELAELFPATTTSASVSLPVEAVIENSEDPLSTSTESNADFASQASSATSLTDTENSSGDEDSVGDEGNTIAELDLDPDEDFLTLSEGLIEDTDASPLGRLGAVEIDLAGLDDIFGANEDVDQEFSLDTTPAPVERLGTVSPFAEDSSDSTVVDRDIPSSEPTEPDVGETAPSQAESPLAQEDLLAADLLADRSPTTTDDEPPSSIEPSPQLEEWFLGIDLGTSGLSAVLMNRVTGAAYPLYWVDSRLGQGNEATFRLPAIATLAPQVSPEGATWELAAVGTTVTAGSTTQTDQLLINALKPLLKIGLPHSTSEGRRAPLVQWTTQQTVPLQLVLTSVQALLSQVRQASEAEVELGAAGLEGAELHRAFGALQGVIVGHPTQWADTYCLNLREAILAARIVAEPSQIFFVEEAIAAILSGLSDPNEPAADPGKTTQTLYQSDWQGGTVVISAGGACTEVGMVDLPHPLDTLERDDFALRNFAYGGDALDLDIICQLLLPPERRQPRAPGNRRQGIDTGWSWRPTRPEVVNARWDSLELEAIETPQLAEPDISLRANLRQHLEASPLGQSLLEAARYLKLILQNQGQYQLELADQSWRVLRRDLESRVLVPYIQRLNQHINALLSRTGLSSQGINQVICTGGSASFAPISKWLRQKFPNATIIQDTYPSNRLPSCSRIAYGLVNLCRYPQLLDVPRHQYSDYFLLSELMRVVPDQPMPVKGILHLLEEQGVNTEACRDRILAILEGHLPPGLVADASSRTYLSRTTLNSETYQAISGSTLFTHQSGQIYMLNAQQRDRLQAHLSMLMTDKYQSLAEPLIAQLVVP
ncbi:MAG: hypothetical protein AAFX01_07090 [Cyanobacteria bacterium J06638_28]